MIIKISSDSEIYKKITEVFDNNKIVCLPTDTIYEFSADGTSQEAIKRLKALKRENLNYDVFLIPKNQFADYVIVSKKKLIDYFIPGPIIFILKRIPEAKIGIEADKIGVKVPDSDFVIKLIDFYKKPIAVVDTGKNDPQEIDKIFPEVALIVDGGTLYGKSSTILDLTTPVPIVRQKGAIPILEIEKIYGRKIKLDPSLKFNLLFVCSGNSCRSPMAEGIIKTMLDTKYVEIKSAGTSAIDGLPASENARNTVKEFGGDISNHRTKCLTKELVDEADLILVMEYKHYETVLELSPDSVVKTFLLKEYKRRAKYNEVSDPVGKDLSAYRDTALEMYPSLKFIARDIESRLIK